MPNAATSVSNRINPTLTQETIKNKPLSKTEKCWVTNRTIWTFVTSSGELRQSFLLFAFSRSQFVILPKGGRGFDKMLCFTYIANEQKRFVIGRIDNKVAIVTWASRGIGKAIVKLWAAEGDRVICATRYLQEAAHRSLEVSQTTTFSEELIMLFKI